MLFREYADNVLFRNAAVGQRKNAVRRIGNIGFIRVESIFVKGDHFDNVVAILFEHCVLFRRSKPEIFKHDRNSPAPEISHLYVRFIIPNTY